MNAKHSASAGRLTPGPIISSSRHIQLFSYKYILSLMLWLAFVMTEWAYTLKYLEFLVFGGQILSVLPLLIYIYSFVYLFIVYVST